MFLIVFFRAQPSGMDKRKVCF